MDQENKEEAKKILGFKQVPFYVVLNEEGDIVQMGSKKYIDFDNLPGMIQPKSEEEGKQGSVEEEKKEESSAFEILDLDF